MGRGRAPCCDKNKVKRGPWSPAEDLRLITFIQKHGHGNWRSLPKQSGLLRCGKSCRLRWINYLRPDVKRGNFTKEEEETIIKLHQSLGNKWSKIASYLPGRTDNEIKNVWNTHLKKRVMVMIKKDNANNGEDDIDANSHQKGDEPKEASSISTASSSISSYASNYSSDSSTSGVLKDVSDHQQVIKQQQQQQQQQSCYISNSDHDHDDHQQVIDIDDPLEPSDDIDDFWDMMLDKLDPLDDQSNIENSHQFEASQGSISFGEDQIYHHHHHDLDREIEYRKWLRYLENELGLIDNQDQAINSTTSHGHGGYHQAAGQLGSSDNNEMMMMMMTMVRPDFDQEEEGNCYFQICSSPPPQNIGI